MNIDDIKELFTAGGGALVVLLTLVQISPIKLNPWSKLAQLIGHALNAEVLEQQKQTQQKLDEHIKVDDERNANADFGHWFRCVGLRPR